MGENGSYWIVVSRNLNDLSNPGPVQLEAFFHRLSDAAEWADMKSRQSESLDYTVFKGPTAADHNRIFDSIRIMLSVKGGQDDGTRRNGS